MEKGFKCDIATVKKLLGTDDFEMFMHSNGECFRWYGGHGVSSFADTHVLVLTPMVYEEGGFDEVMEMYRQIGINPVVEQEIIKGKNHYFKIVNKKTEEKEE